jgi:nucleoside-diphosphate-sugar epimerase
VTKILITGALGHIGSKFIHSVKPGEFDEVRMVDNLLTQRYASLFNLPENVDFSFIEDDILKMDLIAATKDIDVVVHLAAIVDAPTSFKRKSEVERVNYEGAKRVADACIKTGAKLLFPSTTSVYGSQSEVVDENCPAEELKPQSPYAEYKISSEQLHQELARDEGLKFVNCRFGTIFGSSIGMRFHTAVNKFCWQAVMGQPLTIWKTAMNQKRPYLGVNDAVRAIKFIVHNDLFEGELYNVVSSNNTVLKIIDSIRESVPELAIELVESEIMNQLSYEVLAEKIGKLGFEPKDAIDVGISETISLLNPVINA